MKSCMRITFLVVLMLTGTAALAIQAPEAAPATVDLSTAERIALQACEKSKQDAQRQWNEATQQEQKVLSEFAAKHPGFRVNPITFTVEAEHKEPAPAPEAKKK